MYARTSVWLNWENSRTSGSLSLNVDVKSVVYEDVGAVEIQDLVVVLWLLIFRSVC